MMTIKMVMSEVNLVRGIARTHVSFNFFFSFFQYFKFYKLILVYQKFENI